MNFYFCSSKIMGVGEIYHAIFFQLPPSQFFFLVTTKHYLPQNFQRFFIYHYHHYNNKIPLIKVRFDKISLINLGQILSLQRASILTSVSSAKTLETHIRIGLYEVNAWVGRCSTPYSHISHIVYLNTPRPHPFWDNTVMSVHIHTIYIHARTHTTSVYTCEHLQ